MTDKLRKAAQQALDALEKSQSYVEASANKKLLSGWGAQLDRACDAITALREALAEPAEPLNLNCKSVQKRLATQWGFVPAGAQEPFGYFRAFPFGWTDCGEDDEGAIALYEHPSPQQAAPAGAVDAQTVRDAAFEAVRQRLLTLPRYSFALDSRNNLRRCEDKSGNWIEFDAAHALFDPVAVDAALAAQKGGA